LLGVLGGMCGVPLILLIIGLHSVSTPQMKRPVKIAIILFVCGVLSVFAIRGPLGLIFLFLPFILAPLIAVIVSVIQLRSKPPCGRAALIILIIFIVGFSVINARTFVILSSPYIYMPLALNKDNLKVYKECIKFVKNHDELKDLVFYMSGVVSGRKVPASKSEVTSTLETIKKVESEPETAAIAEQLKQIMCSRFERVDDIVIFYKGNQPFIPATEMEIWHIWPSGHGVAYSLSGRDPNQSDDPILVQYKPFIKIYGNWYFSRGLLMGGNGRMYHSIPAIPRTLIDYSLSIKGIDPNELDTTNL
jgi:hypothetical protein